MNNLWRLVKINILQLFSVSNILYSSSKEEKNKNLKKMGLMFLSLIFIGYYVYYIIDLSIGGFILLNIPHIILGQYFASASLFVLFTNIFRIKSTLFEYKDYDLLMSLPIKRSIVILSKLITLYIFNLLYVLVIMIPLLVGYIKYIDVSISFYFYYFVTLFLIPFIPIIISFIIGLIVDYITSIFKNKNIINYIINFGLVFLILFLSFKLENMTSIDMANIGNSMVLKLEKMYPLINLYLDIVKEGKVISFISFVLINIAFIVIFIVFINKYYFIIRERILRKYNVKKQKKVVNSISSRLVGLYKKELRRYFSSTNYVLNSMTGCVLLIIIVIMLLVTGGDNASKLLEIPNLEDKLTLYAPLMLSMFCVLSCTTHSSISLEGKNKWLMKTLPVSPDIIFKSKILVNLTILLPTILIASILVSVYLRFDVLSILFLIITPVLYSIFISCFGLTINLHFPDFEWQNEIKVIKQSVPSFVSVLVGLISVIVPLSINTTLDSNLYIFIVTVIVLILDICLIVYLKTKGKKLFNNL